MNLYIILVSAYLFTPLVFNNTNEYACILNVICCFNLLFECDGLFIKMNL